MHPCDEPNKGGCEFNCTKKGAEAICKCPEHHELKEDGKKCTKVHPCDEEEQGGCTQMCLKDGNGVKCACNEGFELKEDGKTCVEGNLTSNEK